MKNYKWIILIINLFSVSCLSSIVQSIKNDMVEADVLYTIPLKSSDLAFNKLIDNMGIGEQTIIKGCKIYGIDGFLASLQGVNSKIYTHLNGLKPYMPFSKWIIFTDQIKNVLSLPNDIEADGKHAMQLAYFFPKAFNQKSSPKRLIILSNSEVNSIPKKWIQDFVPFENNLIELDEKFLNLRKIFYNVPFSRAKLKFFADYGITYLQLKYALGCANGTWNYTNFFEARHYFKLAADQGSKEAQFDYALMCQLGKGGQKNLVESKKYYKLAAE